MEALATPARPAGPLSGLVPAPAGPACASCSTALLGRYCHACGEKVLHRHDYALKHFLEHAVDAVTHFDLRVLRDLWLQLRRPGLLATEWLQGRRVAHAQPVQLFLVTNLLFYLVASASHFSPFESKLSSHLHSANLYRGLASRLVAGHLQHIAGAFRYTNFERHFNALAHSYSKSLVFLFVPLLLGPLWLLFWRQRRYFVEWIMLATYLFAGILLAYAVVALLSLSAVVAPVLNPLFSNDGIISLLMMSLTAGYVALFFRQVFPPLVPVGQPTRRWRYSLLITGKAVALTLAFAFIMIVPYRFILFLVCYWAATF